MSVVHILLLMFTTFDVLCSARNVNTNDYGLDIKSNYDQRNNILFHLKRGYGIQKGEIPCHFSEIKETNNMYGCKYSLQLFIDVVKCCSVSEQNTRFLARDVICFDDGTCIDIGDPGIHPDQ